jgi:hypothetical protein
LDQLTTCQKRTSVPFLYNFNVTKLAASVALPNCQNPHVGNMEIEKLAILDLSSDAASVALPNCLVKNLHVGNMEIEKPTILDLPSDQITEAALLTETYRFHAGNKKVKITKTTTAHLNQNVPLPISDLCTADSVFDNETGC